jgi:hypothetical protein
VSGGQGFATPRDAVGAFLTATADAKPDPNDPAPLAGACAMLSPDIRAAVRFSEAANADPVRNCSAALALALYYTGDTGEVPAPQGYSGRVTGVDQQGDEAVVSVAMTYLYPSGPRSQATNVLVVRREGLWWIATPGELNVLASLHGPPDRAALEQLYARYVAAARGAQSQQQAAGQLATQLQPSVRSCPAGGVSTAVDAQGDIRLNEGMHVTPDQPESADLVGVEESRDGDALCFQMRFAGAAPAGGDVEIRIRPHEAAVSTSWNASGEVLGQNALSEQSSPVRVEASRAGNQMTFRVPADALGNPATPYRWAVQLAVPIPNSRFTYIDYVPDDQTVQYDGTQYVDHYVVQGG